MGAYPLVMGWLSSAYFITDAGVLLIHLGQSQTEDAETAGVGFIIAPSMRRSVVSFCQVPQVGFVENSCAWGKDDGVLCLRPT